VNIDIYDKITWITLGLVLDPEDEVWGGPPNPFVSRRPPKQEDHENEKGHKTRLEKQIFIFISKDLQSE